MKVQKLFVVCGKVSSRISIKSSTAQIRRGQAENPSELQLERFFSGPMCMKMETNWKELFVLAPVSKFFPFAFASFQTVFFI
jgi:hypothetical protein